QGFGEFTFDGRIAVKWIGKIGQAYLRGLQERRSADRRLQRPPLTGVIGLIEDSVCGGDQPLGASGRVPGDADARSEALLESGDQSRGHAFVSRVQQAIRSIWYHG